MTTVDRARTMVREAEGLDQTMPIHRDGLKLAKAALEDALRDQAERDAQIKVTVSATGEVTLKFSSALAARQHLGGSAQYYAKRVEELDPNFSNPTCLFQDDQAVEANRRAKSAAAAIKDLTTKMTSKENADVSRE